MSAEWVRTTDAADEPITLVDAKAHCRAIADVVDEDALLASYLRASRMLVEESLSRAISTQTWTLTLDAFADAIWLPRAAPLQSVTSVKYYDEDGALQTLSTSVYRVDTASEPGRVVLKPGQSWPAVQSERGQAVEIVYVAGYSAVGSIPGPITAAILLLTTHFYENRAAVQVGAGIGAVEIPWAVQSCLAPYRVYRGEWA